MDVPPSTPSAHRVRVDSSPISSSPLRFLSSMLAANAAEARSHPDATRDVWELAVWDPTPLCLRMFCLLSPGHVLVYWLFLPTSHRDPRPSTTVVTTMVLACLLSVQLMTLQSSFSQQSKDTSIIHKEVLNEYDTKFVHPRIQPLVRDVGTQFTSSESSKDGLPCRDIGTGSVDAYTPTVIINRGFHTRPNPNYLKHVDPEGLGQQSTPSRGTSTCTVPPYQTPAHLRDASSPLRPRTALRKPFPRAGAGLGVGDGGSLGVYSHAESPLRKSASTNFAGGHHERERSVSPVKRDSSLLKRSSIALGPNGVAQGQRRGQHSQVKGTSARRESGRF